MGICRSRLEGSYKKKTSRSVKVVMVVLKYSLSPKVAKYHKGQLLSATILNSLSLSVAYKQVQLNTRKLKPDIIFYLSDDEIRRDDNVIIIKLKPITTKPSEHISINDYTIDIHEPRGELINSERNIQVLRNIAGKLKLRMKKKGSVKAPTQAKT